MADSFHESFDNGPGALGHHRSGNVDNGVAGQITLRGHSGVMERPWGADSGHGYCRYTAAAEVEGDAVGPVALLWPSDDRWPVTEIDFVEVLPHGTAHCTGYHGNDGHDWYEARMHGVDESTIHT